MLKNLSEKYRLFIILACLLLALIICYKVAFKSTFQLAANYKELRMRSKEAGDIPAQTAALHKQLADLNSKYFNEIKGYDDIHETILEKISRLASEYSVVITDFPERHIYRTSSIQIESHAVVIKGGFSDLLHVLYELEVHERVGRIVSIEFYSETDRKTKARFLYMRVYIQNYRNFIPNEES